MTETTKIKRQELLEKLNITEDILSSYEQELDLSSGPESTESFTEEDFKLIQTFHKLKGSGLSHNEIKILSSVSEALKSTDLEGNEEIKNLLALSPVYRLKQSLNLAKQELNSLKEKVHELESALEKAPKPAKGTEDVSFLRKELEVKEKNIETLEKKLSEENTPKGKRAKELYQNLVQKEIETNELKKKLEGLTSKLDESILESEDLRDHIDLIETEFTDVMEEIEARYKQQNSSLKGQVESLIDRKQKEWDIYYKNTGSQHRKELITLQKKHEQEILRLKQKIKEQTEEIEELMAFRNPLVGLIKLASKLR